MRFPGLLPALETDPAVRATLRDPQVVGAEARDITCATSFFATATSMLASESGCTILLVTFTFREAEAIAAEISGLLGEDAVAYYPAWETLPHERLSPRAGTISKRLAVLRRFVSDAPPRVVVAPVRALLRPQVKSLASMRPVIVETGRKRGLTDLLTSLVDVVYNYVDLVERRGEFAVRGGIVDVFPPTIEQPVRIDFFGDEATEIRPFSVAGQRSAGEQLQRVAVRPCWELLLTDAIRRRAAALQLEHPQLSDMLSRLAGGHAVEGMEVLIPVLANGLGMLTDVLPPRSLVLVTAPELVRACAVELVATSEEFLNASWAAAASGGTSPIDLGTSPYRALGEVRERTIALRHKWWSLSPFTAEKTLDTNLDAGSVHSRRLGITPTDNFRGDVDAAITHIQTRFRDGWRLLIGVKGKDLANRMTEPLIEHDITARVSELETEPEAGGAHVIIGPFRHGWHAGTVKLELLTAAELSGQQSAERGQWKLPSRRRNTIQPPELKVGNPIVHEVHGVGRFVELVQRAVQGVIRDYFVIEYAASKRGQPGGRLFMPMDQLDQLAHYIDSETPALDKMGGADWAKRKSRARKAVKEISAELIELYAARQTTKGHALGPDMPWQRELEDAFSFVEIPGQLAAVQEVKADMEKVVPVDRLIYGDVGFGKTEIAVRTAFKAIQDGKQVAVLVSTALLVSRHYRTFASRFAGFPVHMAQLSRFQGEAESRKILEGLVSGRVDLVIGTHWLLAKETTFKDLGLVIIDEEQQLGVEHKERLKELRVNVDVLSMSTTLIPRTLETAITGIREMSVTATPPEECHPVLALAGPYDRGQVRAAIRRELAREGQVFFVHNRVESIDKMAAELRDLVSEVRMVTAHGQMGESKLEQVMLDFQERRTDVLVCTIIVEAGLNIQTANTLIIDRADVLGLSQLRQLRGRVGRSSEHGCAYFLYLADKTLTQTAHERLTTMASHTDLGAGMPIAMRDPELRGAGNLLGGEQSRHIAGVGFDMYLRLMGEAVAQYRGEDTTPESALRIEPLVDAHLPDKHVPSERLRLEMYKQIAEIRSAGGVETVRSELADRYGEPPLPVEQFLAVAVLRNRARELGMVDIATQGKNARTEPVNFPESRKVRLQRLYPGSAYKQTTAQLLVPKPDGGAVAWAVSLLGRVIG